MYSERHHEDNYISNGMIVMFVLLILILIIEAYLILAPRTSRPSPSDGAIQTEQPQSFLSVSDEKGG